MVLNVAKTLENITESKEKKINVNSHPQFEYDIHEKPIDPCIALWRAVITQALIDAGNNFKRREFRSIKANAISWLSGLSEDFEEVCHNADLEPDYVRKMAKEAIARDCKWRNDHKNPFRRTIEKKPKKQLTKLLSSDRQQEQKSAEVIPYKVA